MRRVHPFTTLRRFAVAALLAGAAGASQALPITYQVQLFDDQQVQQGEGSFILDNVAADPTNVVLQSFDADGLQDFDVIAFDFVVAGAIFGLADLDLLDVIADGTGKVTDYFFSAENADGDTLAVFDAPQFEFRFWAVQVLRQEFGINGTTEGSISTVTVPEPSTVALLGLGAIGLLRRRLTA